MPDEPIVDRAVDAASTLWLEPADRASGAASGPAARGSRTTWPGRSSTPRSSHALAEQVAERIGTDPYADDPLGGDDAPGDPQLLDEADLAEIRAGAARPTPAVQAALDGLWPVLTPQRLLADLFAVAGAARRAPRRS